MWRIEAGELVAVEPGADEIAAAAVAMAAFYNEGREMMANESVMSAADVVDWYGSLRSSGGRAFFLHAGGELVGDADLRDFEGGAAEFAIVLGARTKGRGLGTRFAAMIHALAFERLGLERMRVSIVPANAPSIRLFEKLGYVRDDSPAARSLVDAETDVTMSVDRAAFEAAIGSAALAEMRFEMTEP